jgi:hypothetical protein
MPRCPVCKKPLSQEEYDKALGILGAREQHLEHQKAKLVAQVKRARDDAAKARASGVQAERSRTQRLLAGKDQEIKRLNERLRQLKRGSTPQTEGLEFEVKLVARLAREFPEDNDSHEGKAGDVVHEVFVAGKPAGIIVYECKRESRISEDHVAQAGRAKHSRRADFAVLVTIGTRRGFTGLAEMAGVLVVSPLGVVALVSLLREQLRALARARLRDSERQRAAQRLLAFITSPDFRNPIEAVIRTAGALQKSVLDEASAHRKLWERRWQHYHAIAWDASLVRSNVQLVLQGKQPSAHLPPKPSRLALPGPSSA